MATVVSQVVSSLTGSSPEVYDLIVVGSGFAVITRLVLKVKSVLKIPVGFYDHIELPRRMQEAWQARQGRVNRGWEGR